MENKIEKALSDFVDVPENQENEQKNGNAKKVILDEREGLIERVDRIYITKEGKQLLREQY